jgi:hypothetical protein
LSGRRHRNLIHDAIRRQDELVRIKRTRRSLQMRPDSKGVATDHDRIDRMTKGATHDRLVHAKA